MAVNWRQVAYQSAVNAGHPDPDMFVRQMLAESGLRPGQVSSAGAAGIAQIMPSTAKAWGVDPNDPYASLSAAAKAMTKYMRSYNGNSAMALAAYNAGPGAVAQYRGVPPYGETKAYIAKIMGGKGSPIGSAGAQPTANGGMNPLQTAGPNPVAVSNQINRIGYAYGEHGALAQPHIDKLAKSLTGGSGALTNPTLEPAAVGSTNGKGVPPRRPGELGWQYLQRIGSTLFGLKNDPGNSQTTGGAHTAGSDHYRGTAIDWGNGRNSDSSIAKWDAYVNRNREALGISEHIAMGSQSDHMDHSHSSTIRSSKPSRNTGSVVEQAIRPTNSRRRPVRKNRTPK